jgi:hypothetical protein
MTIQNKTTRGHKKCQLTLLLALTLSPTTQSYHRAPCTTTSVRRQFQYSDCYAPRLNPSLPLAKASFVMAHDAATGYLPDPSKREFEEAMDTYSKKKRSNHRWNGISKELLALYGKTQVGSVYDQLNDGARALDLRPKMYANGTVGFHRGSIVDIPLSSITLGGLLEDAKKWVKDNPKELVIIFHSQMVHEAGYNGLSSKVYMEADDDAYTGNDDGVKNNNYYEQQQQQAAAASDDANDNADEYQYNYQYDYQDDGLQQNMYQYETYRDEQYAYADDGSAASSSGNQGYSYFYTAIAKMKEVYENHGVPYYPCKKLAGLTVEEALELADLSAFGGKGYLMAVDRHDVYGE